ncbi:aspartate kinase [Bittarella massiliensis (ex Durand et al. 2017)]|uniref:aspartate kinase n=1 Tax=Bittarella massiliensis (ex Durand et al. 2017) TaxID=1720313 RepID=UPI001AA0B258|nr:aspartate kinase [Bittarella massiliensis (ex Durand et al. 2017)]MBO1680042.1 aspartate kinase [Bittarella massiliensis (ex Durand et al. 2017)]
MALVVQKFGGSSVRDAERVRNVAQIVTDTYKAGNNVVVVVSAQGDTTDDLIEKAAELNPSASKREMDMLLSSGEQQSCALLAMAIEAMGYPAISLTGWQAGFFTTSNYSNARIHRVDTERLQAELDRRSIVVVAGFQGLNKFDDITTLGRGGSDTSAVALAASLHADTCQIYTDVDGVYTADPRKVKNAKKLDEISFDEMLELATLGAQVLHNRSVEMAKKFGVQIEVLSSLSRVPGTIVKEDVKMEKMLIKGVAKDEHVVRITVDGVADQPGTAFKIFSLLSNHKINVDIILQTPPKDGFQAISFTISDDQKDEALAVLGRHGHRYPGAKIYSEDDIAKVSIVGAGMQSNPGVAADMFAALGDAGVNIKMISTSEIKISVIIDRADADRAVSAIHSAFYD